MATSRKRLPNSHGIATAFAMQNQPTSGVGPDELTKNMPKFNGRQWRAWPAH